MRVMFEEKSDPTESIDVLSHTLSRKVSQTSSAYGEGPCTMSLQLTNVSRMLSLHALSVQL